MYVYRLMKDRFLSSVRADRLFYIIAAGAFLGGAALAVIAVSAMPELQGKEILLYMDDFFGFLNEQAADGNQIFRTALCSNAWSFILLSLCALSVAGILFVGGFCAFKGFINGFLIGFMFRMYGTRALLFLLAGMLPHALLLLPCYLFYTTACMKLSVSIAGTGLANIRQRAAGAAGVVLVFWLLALSASLLQGYIEPIFLKLASGMFLAG